MVSFTDVKFDFRIYKESLGKVISGNVRKIMNIANTLPVSTAECDKGFSKMNLICTDLKSMLTVSHMSTLLFVLINGPPVSHWQPMLYLKTWLPSNRHTTTCTSCPAKRIPATAGNTKHCGAY